MQSVFDKLTWNRWNLVKTVGRRLAMAVNAVKASCVCMKMVTSQQWANRYGAAAPAVLFGSDCMCPRATQAKMH